MFRPGGMLAAFWAYCNVPQIWFESCQIMAQNSSPRPNLPPDWITPGASSVTKFCVQPSRSSRKIGGTLAKCAPPSSRKSISTVCRSDGPIKTKSRTNRTSSTASLTTPSWREIITNCVPRNGVSDVTKNWMLLAQPFHSEFA